VNVGATPDDGAVTVVAGGAELEELAALRGFALSLHAVTRSAAATTRTTPRRCIRAMVEVVVRPDAIT